MVNTLSKPAPPLCHCSVNTLQSPTSEPCQARGPKGTAFIWAIVKPERGGIDSYLRSISICGIHVAGGQHFALFVYCDPHSSSACRHPYTQKQADKNSSQKKKIIIFGGGLVIMEELEARLVLHLTRGFEDKPVRKYSICFWYLPCWLSQQREMSLHIKFATALGASGIYYHISA